MRPDLHQDYGRWVAAAVRGQLCPSDRDLLARHQGAACPECGEQAATPQAVARVAVALNSRDALPADFESRVVDGFRRRVWRPSWRAVGRSVCRVVLVGVWVTAALVMAVRPLNVRVMDDHGAAGSLITAFWQAVMQAPEYSEVLGRGQILSDHEELLATVHKLTTLYVEMFLWLVLAVPPGLMIVHGYRRRGHLGPAS